MENILITIFITTALIWNIGYFFFIFPGSEEERKIQLFQLSRVLISYKAKRKSSRFDMAIYRISLVNLYIAVLSGVALVIFLW